MGGAAVALRNDPACGYWNPAGLSGLRGFQFETQHTFLALGQELDYIALANGFRDRFFYGVSAFFYSPGSDLEARSGPTLSPDSYFTDIEMAFIASFAVRFSPRWSLGWNLKIYSESLGIANFSGFGVGEDLGIQYRFTKDTTFGLMAEDPFSVFSYSNSNEQIFPIKLKAGIAQHDENLSAKLNCDLEWSSDLGFGPRLGVEWRPAEVIALRAGAKIGNLTGGVPGGSLSLSWSTGLGILVPLGDSLLQFDYTLLPDPITEGGLLHQISVVGKFL
jgi:hypothetical protein